MLNSTRRQAIFQYLIAEADSGKDDVAWACRTFLKKIRLYGINKTARKKIPKYWVERAFRNQKGLCARTNCGLPIEPTDLTGDHKVPLNRGGEHSQTNIRAFHRRCNSSKSDNDEIEESVKTGRTILEQIREARCQDT